MAGEALGIRDYDPVRVLTEDFSQRMNLRRRAAAASRCIRFVGNEYHLGRHLASLDAAPCLGARYQLLHYLADVLDI